VRLGAGLELAILPRPSGSIQATGGLALEDFIAEVEARAKAGAAPPVK
jgi:hypothetical protein